jgi:hypothetical protein
LTILSGLAAAPAISCPQQAKAKSYSTNAKNLERLNENDFSGGAEFDNNPTSERAKKRRALQGCRSPLARSEAQNLVGGHVEASVASEKECNSRVMEGDAEFMLETLRKLYCPKCPYGIKT